MLVTQGQGTLTLLTLAVVMGAGQALIFPCTVALISHSVHGRLVGTGMGFLGTLQNGGKVLGPILGGLLIMRFDYTGTFYLLGMGLIMGAFLVWVSRWNQPMLKMPGHKQTSPTDTLRS